MIQTLTRAGRLLVLYRLREAGLLKGQTLQALADRLGVNRSTIVRDVEMLDLVDEEYERLMELRPWLEPGPAGDLRDAGYMKIRELAAASGYFPDHLRLLVREGKVEAKKLGNRWWVHPRALQAYLEDRDAGPGAARGPQGPRK